MATTLRQQSLYVEDFQFMVDRSAGALTVIDPQAAKALGEGGVTQANLDAFQTRPTAGHRSRRCSGA